MRGLARAELAVGDLTELAGTQAIVVQGHAKVSGLAAFLATIDDRFTSWVDVHNGRPLRFQTDEYASGSKTDIEHAVVDLVARDGSTVPVPRAQFGLGSAFERNCGSPLARTTLS